MSYFLTLMLALATAVPTVSTAASNVTKYLFVPGHGLTAKSGNPATTTDQLIDECINTGPWMQFVEREYFWGDLQNGGPPGTNNPGSFITGVDANGNPKGISKIIDDANKCYAAGLKFRVMLMHKFADLPRFLTYPSDESIPVDVNTDGNLATVIARDPETGMPTNYNIKLDKPVVLEHLKDLYAAVIAEFKKSGNANARTAFYGFVIQEHAFGTSAYWTDDVGTVKGTRTKWVDNLIAFDNWLAGGGRLYNFATGTATPHRLFWQMINSPKLDATRIAANLPNGGGLDGPDTFPLEPAPQPEDNGKPPREALHQSYNRMRENRKERPLALHVYANNYWNPYVHADKEVTFVGDDLPTLGPRPIWGRDINPGINNAGTIGSYWEAGLGAPLQNNGWAGTGIANFLGCVSPWAKTLESYDPAVTKEIDNLNVNNVVWVFTTFVPEKAEYQGFNPATDAYGWMDVREWMNNTGPIYGPGGPEDSAGQFPRGSLSNPNDGDPAGGCTITIPIKINTTTVP